MRCGAHGAIGYFAHVKAAGGRSGSVAPAAGEHFMPPRKRGRSTRLPPGG